MGKVPTSPNRAWPNLIKTRDQTTLSIEYWCCTRTSKVKCSIDRLTVHNTVSSTRSTEGGSPASSEPSSSSLGCLEVTTADFFAIISSLFFASSNSPLSWASCINVFSVGPDRSGCFSLRSDGDRSLRFLAIAKGSPRYRGACKSSRKQVHAKPLGLMLVADTERRKTHPCASQGPLWRSRDSQFGHTVLIAALHLYLPGHRALRT